MLVGTAPGGINDISARLVAKHLGRFIPGNPTIVVQNNPGAGGLITANKLYNNAEKDGSVLAKFERAVPQLQIQGDPNAQFDSTKFVWLGSLSSYTNDAYLLLVNAGNRVKNVEELRRPGMPLTLGSDNSASSNQIFAVIAKEILGPQRQRDPRLHRRRQPVPGDAERRARRPVRGPELGAQRPARPVEQGRVPPADGVRPHHPASGFSRAFRSAAR